MRSNECWLEGTNLFPRYTDFAPVDTAQDYAARTHCWLMFSSLSSMIPWGCSQGSQSSVCLTVRGSSFPCTGLGICPLLNFIRLLSAPSSSLSRPLWMAALPSSTLTGHPILVSPATLMRVHSVTPSRSLIKMLKRKDPRMHSCGTYSYTPGRVRPFTHNLLNPTIQWLLLI